MTMSADMPKENDPQPMHPRDWHSLYLKNRPVGGIRCMDISSDGDPPHSFEHFEAKWPNIHPADRKTLMELQFKEASPPPPEPNIGVQISNLIRRVFARKKTE